METTLKDFADLKFRRRDGDYEDADEAAKEPIWESYRHDRPITDDTALEALWEGNMGIRQVKDLFKRGTTRQWSGDMFDTWAAKEPRGVHAFGGQQKINRQINLIRAAASHALTIIRTKTTPLVCLVSLLAKLP